MTIEVERLLVTLEARIDQYEKNLARARGTTDSNLAAIEARGRKMETAFLNSTGRGVRGFDTLGKSVKSTEVQVGSLAAQFNDIGVQLAGGQSPFLVALQQGSQITQAFGGAGVKGAIVGVGGALASLVSPISLVTIGLIAAGGYAIQYFATLLSDGEKSNLTLEEQQALIERVAQKWGEAYPAIKAYNDEAQRTKEQADLLAAIDIVKADQLKNIPALLDQIKVEMADFISQLQLAGEQDESIIDLQNAINSASDAMRDGRDASGDLNTAIGILQTGIENTANPAVQSMIEMLLALQKQAQASAIAVANVVNSAAKIQEQLQNTIQAATFREEDGTIRSTDDFVPKGDTPTPTKRDPVELEGFPTYSAGGSSSASTDQFKSATAAMEDRMRALQAQFDAQSKLNPLVNDYGYAVEFAKAKQELLTAAQNAGKEVTPQLGAEIERVASAYAKTSAEVAKLAEQQKASAAAIQFQKDTLSGFLSDLRSGLEDGKLSWEDLGTAAVNVLNKIADKLQSLLIDQMFAKGFGGLFGSISGLGGVVVGGLSGAGGVGAGALASTAVSAAKLPSVAKIAAAQSLDVRVSVDDEGALKAYVEKEGRRTEARVAAGGKATLDNYRRNQLHNDIDSHMRNPRRRGSI